MKRPDSREVAHDFNNLLTAIIGAADAVLERSGVDPETRADIAHIREGARRGAMLIRRLHDDAGDALVSPELISVNETIRATWRLLDHRLGAGVAFRLDLAESSGHVLADPAQLDRMLLNLIANARHAMPDGGTVTLGTARRLVAASESLVPDTIPSGDYVVITVADSGTGIPADLMPRVFEAGFSSRTEAGGSGLGLSSTRDIVRQSNGFLSIDSAEGRGTRFEIYLPRVESMPSTAVAEAASGSTAPTVLLVEDDTLVRQVAERALHRAGWAVLCADSAEKALELLKLFRCDLMISDVVMPGMDGLALARFALELYPELPVILTSGYERAGADSELGLANVVFLTKPYGQKELLAVVGRFVPEGGADGASARRDGPA